MHPLPELMLDKASRDKIDERTPQQIASDLYHHADRLGVTLQVTGFISRARQIHQADEGSMLEFVSLFDALLSQIEHPDDAFLATMHIEQTLAHTTPQA